MRAFSGAPIALTRCWPSGRRPILTSAGCSQVGIVQARRAAKAANQAYTPAGLREAAELYQHAIEADPNLGYAYFYLANSYDNSISRAERASPTTMRCSRRPSRTTRPGSRSSTRSRTIRTSCWRAAASSTSRQVYGADKLNDPAKAEPVIQKLIQMDPSDPGNYFLLAKIYEDAGAYAEAEQTYQNAKNVKPNDPAVYMKLAAYYNRQGQFDKTIEALEQRAQLEPNNPEAFQTIAGVLLGRNAARRAVERPAEARVRPEGPRGGRQGAVAQERLRRGAHLQGPAAAAAGAPRKGSRSSSS